MDEVITIKEIKNTGDRRITTMPDVYYMPYVGDKRTGIAAETYDIAMLAGIAYKYFPNEYGRANHFLTFACRMLKIKSVWSE